MTGFPLRTGFGRGVPEHDPWRFEASRLIDSGEADCAVWISAYGTRPPAWKRDLPLVALTAIRTPLGPRHHHRRSTRHRPRRSRASSGDGDIRRTECRQTEHHNIGGNRSRQDHHDVIGAHGHADPSCRRSRDRSGQRRDTLAIFSFATAASSTRRLAVQSMKVYDMSNKIVMAGAIDIHSHIAGSNETMGRLVLPEHRYDLF